MSEFNQPIRKAIVQGFGEYPLPLSGDASSQLEVLSRKGNSFRIRFEGRQYSAEVVHFDPQSKTAQINIDGSDYFISIEEPIDRLIKELGFLQAARHSVKEIRSPMPGMVVNVFVSAGQVVHEGDALFGLEAMKMENIIKSPGEGTVREVCVSKGAAVEKNQILMEFD